MTSSSALRLLLLAGALLAILAPTMIPLSQLEGLGEPTETSRLLYSADVLRNLVLFLPLGAVLASLGVSAPRCLALALLLSGSIETVQLWIPGRYPSLLDLVVNALGAALGHALFRSAPLWLSPPTTLSRLLVLATGVTTAGLVLGTGALLAPSPIPDVYHAHWTAERADLHPWEGQVLSVAVNGFELLPGRVRVEALEGQWLSSDYRLELSLLAGPPPPGLSAFFTLSGAEHAELLLIGPDREDLVFRYRSPSFALGLEWASLRWLGGLRGIEVGQRFEVKLEKIGAAFCVAIDQERRCGLGFNHADGWQLLAPAFRYPPAALFALTSLWLGALFLPLGFWSRRDAATFLAWSLVAASLLLTSTQGDLLPIPIAVLLAAAAAAGLGAWLRGLADSRLTLR